MFCGHTTCATSTWLPSFLQGEVCEMFCTWPFCFPGNLEMKKCCSVAVPPFCSGRTDQNQLWQCRAFWPLFSLLRLRSRTDGCNALTHTQGTDWNLPKYLNRRNHTSLVFAWEFSWSKWEGNTGQGHHLEMRCSVRHCPTRQMSLGLLWAMDFDCSCVCFLHRLNCWSSRYSHLHPKYFFVLLSSSGKVLLLPKEQEPPRSSSDWERSRSPWSEVFFQLQSKLKNAQGRHFCHLCLQIPGDIFLHVHWELGSPGSLSGMPRHWKTIPSLTQISLL